LQVGIVVSPHGRPQRSAAEYGTVGEIRFREREVKEPAPLRREMTIL